MPNNNFLTPTEAISKLCPYIHYAGLIKEQNCIGPKCMAWRWTPDEKTGFCGVAGSPEINQHLSLAEQIKHI